MEPLTQKQTTSCDGDTDTNIHNFNGVLTCVVPV